MVRAGNFVYLRNAWPDLPLPGASDTFYTPSADALRERRGQGGLTPLQEDVFAAARPAEEFYDLAADPHEAHNLAVATTPPPELLRLRALLDRWTAETGDTVPAKRTPSNIELATGRRLSEFWRGDAPGAAAGATGINAPGPIRAP